jgi:hypothetical protein
MLLTETYEDEIWPMAGVCARNAMPALIGRMGHRSCQNDPNNRA